MKKPATHIVIILEERCKLCNICVHFCPVADLSIAGGRLQQSGKCNGCGACQMFCPDLAIYPVKKTEKSDAKNTVAR